MTPRRPPVLAAALLASLLTLSAVGNPAAGQSPTGFIGIDGIAYDFGPKVVAGGDGYYFMGYDFDGACGLANRFGSAMKKLTKLAHVIERSGRQVVFTVAPNKTAVMPQRIDRSTVPHGICADTGLEIEKRVLDRFSDPLYLPLRKTLAESPHQVYWRTDLHWSTVGGAVFAKTLAGRLSKRLGKQQRYTYGVETGLGLLNEMRGDETQETLQSAQPANGVQVTTAAGAPDWAGYPTLTYDHSWNSSPARKTYPGHTLVIGDSFAMFGLDSLRPLFRHGRFMWFAHTDQADIAAAVKDADTVVIEVVQLFTVASELTTPSFRHAVKAALRHKGSHHS